MSYMFCEICRKLSKFVEIKQNPQGLFSKKKKYVKCSQWSAEISEDSLIDKIYGFVIDQTKEDLNQRQKRINAREKWLKKISLFNESQRKKITEVFECPICLKIIDTVANLQWLHWNHSFCFYCLITSLKTNDNCPWCRSCITLECLQTNTTLISNLNFSIKVAISQEIFCNLHNERCDIYWRLCKQEVWCEWIISNIHQQHELVSIKSLCKETKDIWSQQRESLNSLIQDGLTPIDHIKNNKGILDQIRSDLFKPYTTYIQLQNMKYQEQVDKSHCPFAKEMTKNVESSIKIKPHIENFTNNDSKANLLQVIRCLESQKQLAAEFKSILSSFENGLLQEKLPVFSKSVKEKFTWDYKELKRNQEIAMQPSSEESKIWSVNLTRVDTDIAEGKVNLLELNSTSYYVKWSGGRGGFITIIDSNQIFKIQHDQTVAIKFQIDSSKVTEDDKVEIELSFWQITEEIEEYILKFKESIKADLVAFIDTI